MLRVLAVSCLACIASLLFGYSLGFTSPAMLPMEIAAEHETFAWRLTPVGVVSPEAAAFGALVNIGAMGGALLGGPISDRLGRRFVIGLTGLTWLVAWLGLAGLPSFVFAAPQTRPSHQLITLGVMLHMNINPLIILRTKCEPS